MGDIIKLWERSTLDIPPEEILKGAQEADLRDVIVIGVRRDGREYFASSGADGGAAIWRLERAKLKLLREGD